MPERERDTGMMFSSPIKPPLPDAAAEGPGLLSAVSSFEGLVGTETYIPAELAKQKVNSLVNDYSKLKTNYEEYVSRLSEYYTSYAVSTRKYYEDLVSDAKAKALRHVEILQKLKSESEEKLLKDIAGRDEDIENYRDRIVTLRLDYQALNRTLLEKTTLFDKTVSEFEAKKMRYECALAVSDLLVQLEEGGSSGVSSTNTNTNTNTGKVESPTRRKVKVQADHEAAPETALADIKEDAKASPLKTGRKTVRSAVSSDVAVASTESDAKVAQTIVDETIHVDSETHSDLQHMYDDLHHRYLELQSQMLFGENNNDAKSQVTNAETNTDPVEANAAPIETKIAPVEANAAPPVSSTLASLPTESSDKQPANDAMYKELQQQYRELEERLNAAELSKKEMETKLAERPVAEPSVAASDPVAEASREREAVGAEIKEWIERFHESRGRPPDKEDKKEIKDKYLLFKALTARVEKLTLGGGEEPDSHNAPAVPEVESRDGVKVYSDSDTPQVAIEKLEDRILELQSVNSDLHDATAKAGKESEAVKEHLAELQKMRYSDYVQKMKDELNELEEKNLDLSIQISSDKGEIRRIEMKLQEMTDRTSAAEKELVRRDEIDKAKCSPGEEMYKLKSDLAAQRNELIAKTKAVTAGWEAAAVAEDKLEEERERAFKKGSDEARKKAALSMSKFTTDIETRDENITNMMTVLAALKQQAVALEEDKANLKKELELANLEVLDAMKNGSDGSDGMVDNSELQSALADLNVAQANVVELSTKCEKLNKKVLLLEKLSRLPANGSAAASAAMNSSGGADYSSKIELCKSAISAGTSLWKNNKRDECYAAYLKCCEELNRSVMDDSLRGPIHEAIMAARAQPKARGAIDLRKGLDNFIAIAVNKKTDVPPAPIAAPTTSAYSERSALQQQIAALTDEINSGDDAEGGAEGDPTNAMLLRRSQEADRLVEKLKKQLNMALASANTSAPPAASGGSSGGKSDANAQLEVRKLQKRIKELEGSGGSGGPAADGKAAIAAQKLMEKKVKELEASFRKERAALETRAKKAEESLEGAAASLPAITAERDQLGKEVAGLNRLVAQLEPLRDRAKLCDELELAMAAQKKEIDTIAAQFAKESALRKKYKNELEDLKGAIRVYARCRPFARYEIEKGCKSVVEIDGETTVKVASNRGDKEFEFDNAFGMNSTQEQIFEDTKRLVESCIDGFNVCLFAYGQTGSGKTFTMTGSVDLPGLTPRAVNEIFRLAEEKKHLDCKVSTYFVELYNDNLVDLYWLLDNKKGNEEPPKLDIKVDAKKMVQIKGVITKDVYSASELMNLYELGNKQRHVGATKMNAESSRSHSIFAILIESYDKNTKRTTSGKISLVDLAGSERADKTGAQADRLKEAQSINKSLSALGDVISALSEGEKFIPYRNNKLTQVMQDSLGGNAKTLMFVNFSPADYNADETVTSLNYATRVKKIVNNASKQNENSEIVRLKNIIKQLKGGDVDEEP